MLAIQLPKLHYGAPDATNRFVSIDGLRGYLGLFVFIFHASTKPHFLRTGEWQSGPALAQFGEISVLMFFMITGLLFTDKLLRAGRQSIDWLRLFVGRFLRLAPLYSVAMVVLTLIVLSITGFNLKQEPLELARRIGHWAIFTLYYAPDVNGVKDTTQIMSGVVWTLPYEWMFYLALPVFAMVLRQKVSWILVAFCGALAGSILVFNHRPMCMLAFATGMATAYALRSDALRDFARGQSASVLIVTCLVVTFLGFKSAHTLIPTLLVSVAFVLIACGNSLWGSLTTATSRLLGECSYGLYLLHGFVLYLAYYVILGQQKAASLSAFGHLVTFVACTVSLVLISYATFRLIESPALRKTTRVTAYLRRDKGTASVQATA